MPIKATRALLAAALDGTLANAEMRIDPHFRFRVPVAVPGVDTKILNPRDTWADKAAYDAQASKLVAMFRENFKNFEAHVGRDVLQAAPQLARSRGITKDRIGNVQETEGPAPKGRGPFALSRRRCR